MAPCHAGSFNPLNRGNVILTRKKSLGLINPGGSFNPLNRGNVILTSSSLKNIDISRISFNPLNRGNVILTKCRKSRQKEGIWFQSPQSGQCDSYESAVRPVSS